MLAIQPLEHHLESFGQVTFASDQWSPNLCLNQELLLKVISILFGGFKVPLGFVGNKFRELYDRAGVLYPWLTRKTSDH